MREVCKHLDLPFEPERIPRFKAGIRPGGHTVTEFYDAATEEAVRQRYQFEFSHFGYQMPTS